MLKDVRMCPHTTRLCTHYVHCLATGQLCDRAKPRVIGRRTFCMPTDLTLRSPQVLIADLTRCNAHFFTRVCRVLTSQLTFIVGCAVQPVKSLKIHTVCKI